MDDVRKSVVDQPTDAVVRLTSSARSFPTGQMMNRNLTIKARNRNPRACVPHLVEQVRSGVTDPVHIRNQIELMITS